MATWHWLIVGLVALLVALSLVPVLRLLERLWLWLEKRDWLHYRNEKPTGSSMSAWGALQQFVEPGVRHVIQVKQRQNEEDQEARRRG